MKLNELYEVYHRLAERNVDANVIVEVEGERRTPTSVREVTERGQTTVVLVVPAKRMRASRAKLGAAEQAPELKGVSDDASNG